MPRREHAQSLSFLYHPEQIRGVGTSVLGDARLN
jgi:hypothetical protein